MARGAGDDEYQELQKRFATLENERKNLFEHTQVRATCASSHSRVSRWHPRRKHAHARTHAWHRAGGGVTLGDRMAAGGEEEQEDSGRPKVRQQEAALRPVQLDERPGQEHQQLRGQQARKAGGGLAPPVRRHQAQTGHAAKTGIGRAVASLAAAREPVPPTQRTCAYETTPAQ